MKKLSVLLIFVSQICLGQGLFESAGQNEGNKLSYQLNGYVRGAYFVGEHLQNKDVLTTQAAYGEAALKLKVKKVGFGEAFTDIRFKNGYRYGKKVNLIDVREAYIKYNVSKFNFSIGKQIVVWGRADGYNPTDMLSLKDMLNRSADTDDKRFGNWMLNGGYNIGVFSLEGVWIPVYDSWNIPFGFMGADTAMRKPEYPNFSIKNSSYAFRLNMQGAKIDGSLSYFNGYNPKPAINGNVQLNNNMNIMLKAYRTNMFGADFQTTVGKIGLRGEFAYSHPEENDTKFLYKPNPDLQWVIGADRTFGGFMFNVQYIGKWVQDFTELKEASNPYQMFDYMMQKQNRMLSGQQYEFAHSTSLNISQKLFQENLDLSAFAMYNISTEEYMIRSKASYFITDAMEVSLGAEIYSGPNETLFGQFGKVLNCGFVEMKVSF